MALLNQLIQELECLNPDGLGAGFTKSGKA